VAVAIAFAPSMSMSAEPKGAVSKERLARVDGKVDALLPDLEKIYVDFHRNPELSLQEVRTSARLAKELEDLGFEVTTKVGQTGVVGLLKNGDGPLLLVRTDMDALPVVEATNLPYASKVVARDRKGQEVGVMHACGHDIHMTSWVGTARVMASMKDKWAGTLMFIAQPAEEIGTGARLMLADGLYKRFGKPDYCLALHADNRMPHGHVSFTEGLAMANVDTVEILVKGRGGHGSAPHTTIDPIVLAAKIVIDLQTIVSRERDPVDPAVVTVGSIHGGTKSNIIPNEVRLQLTVRTTKDSTRKSVLEAIARLTKAAAMGARAPEPVITIVPDEFTPALYNDVKLTRRITGLFGQIIGEDKLHERPVLMGGEDFSRYALQGEIPIFMYWLGSVSDDRYTDSLKETGKPLPSMHSDSYYPLPAPTIRTGVRTMSMAILELVGR